MSRRNLPPLLLAFLLLFSACSPVEEGAGQSPSPAAGTPGGQTPAPVPFSLAVYPTSPLNPLTTGNRTNLTLAPLLYEGLVALDEGFTPRPLLCESWQGDQAGLVWTFRLRPGLTFSDGTPLTGELAAASLRLAAGKDSPYAARLAGAAITGKGDTVTITLSAPNGALPALLNIPIVSGDQARPLGTGPYILEEVGDSLALVPRPDWGEGAALPVPRIPLAPVRQADDLIAAFDAGNVTLLDADLMGANALGYSGSYEVWEYPATGLVYLGPNTRKGPCAQAGVRRQLAAALNRQAVADGPYAGHATPTTLPVHPVSPLYAAGTAPPAGEGGNLPTQKLRLLTTAENPVRLAAAELLAGQLEEAGFAVEVAALPWDAYRAALQKGEFDLYLAEVWMTPDFDPSPLLAAQGALNYGGWENGETQALLAAFRGAQGAARSTAAAALYAHLEETAPILPVCFKNGSVLTQWGRVSGLTPVQRNVFYGLPAWSVD